MQMITVKAIRLDDGAWDINFKEQFGDVASLGREDQIAALQAVINSCIHFRDRIAK